MTINTIYYIIDSQKYRKNVGLNTMEETKFYIICTAIILITNVIIGIINTCTMIKKPAKKYRERQDAELKEKISDTLKEILPVILTEHDLQVRERYVADRERYLQDIKASVLTDINGRLDQIDKLTVYYDVLTVTAKDVLREKIVTIYLNNKHNKTLTVLERERLDQLYKDYKSLKGNTYIDKYYKRMEKWETVDDDENLDDDII